MTQDAASPNGNRVFKTPAQKATRGLCVGIPTLGLVHIDFATSLGQQNMPINFGCIYMTTPEGVRWDWDKNEPVQVPNQRGLPVADARNVMAYWCLKNNIEYLFFRDDDTICPPDSINKLFTLLRDMQDQGKPVACIGGNYMSKQMPPHSLILIDGHLGGYENWEPGDIVGGEKTAIGMGCTLIPTAVLAKMEPPWFKTVDSLDPNAQVFNPLAGGIVKTGNDIQDVAPGCVRMTEDVYFCRKASRYGFTQVWCDTSIQCVHVDINTGRKYFYHGGLKRGVWQDGPAIGWFLRPGEKFIQGEPFPGFSAPNGEQAKPIEQPPKPEVVRFDLGTPGKKEGWITIDLFEASADEQVDIHDLRPVVRKYGQAEEIRASHILEHFPFREAVPLIHGWLKALKPGGKFFVEVPDAEWGCENLLKYLQANPDEWFSEVYKIIGFQSNPGDFHKNLFCKKMLFDLLSDPAFGLEDVTVEHYSYPDPKVQRAIRAWATKKKEPINDGTDLSLDDAGREPAFRRHLNAAADPLPVPRGVEEAAHAGSNGQSASGEEAKAEAAEAVPAGV